MKVHKCICGSNCELSQFIDHSRGYPKKLFYVKCSKCGRESVKSASSSKAVDMWNEVIRNESNS